MEGENRNSLLHLLAAASDKKRSVASSPDMHCTRASVILEKVNADREEAICCEDLSPAYSIVESFMINS